jgi:SAM-dependent methyltransferase
MVAAQWRPGEAVPEMPDPLPVLDAGCGTGHSPVQAARMYHRCRVTAVDISKASLGYAARMAEKYGVESIDFRCGDILKLGVLRQRFAIILCGGVLHHLERPLEGWRVLTSLLLEGGLMRIALYSTYARKNVAAARALLADSVSGELTLKQIRRCRQAILDLPDSHPAKTLVFSSDFRSASGFRDLVLHAREHTFTLPEIGVMLQQLGLRFLGFELPPGVLGVFKHCHPQQRSETDLDLWDKFEQEHQIVFGGMYQFWCSR